MSSRIVLITGANSGVGYATTTVLAQASDIFHVIMTGRSLDKVEKAKSEIEFAGIKGTLEALQLDVTDPKSITDAARYVEEKHKKLDVLINNAAVGSMDPDLKTRMQSCLNTNVLGPALVSEAFRPLLLRAPNPYSIFVGSGAGSMTRAATSERHFPYEEAYRVSKTALNMLAVIEKRDYEAQGLKVFAMCPGFVVSNLRGTSEEMRTGFGNATSPIVSGETILSMLKGKRDAETGLLVHKDGVYPW